MINYDKVIEGIIKFVDTDLLPKMDGYQKWMFGTICGIAGKKGRNIFESIKDNTMLKALDIVEGDLVNVDLIYEELIKQASTTPMRIDIPLLGTITLHKNDVDKIHNYIMNGGYNNGPHGENT